MNQKKNNLFRRVGAWLGKPWQVVLPGKRAWTGAAIGLLVAALVFVFPTIRADFGGLGLSGMAVGLTIFLVVGALAALAAWLLKRLLDSVPHFYIAAAAGTLALLYLSFFPVTFTDPTMKFQNVLLAICLIASVLGAAAWVLLRGGWKQASTTRRIIITAGLSLGLAGAGWGGAWLLSAGQPVQPPVTAANQAGVKLTPLSLDDPSQSGPYTVSAITYGSGKDLRRPEYGANAGLITQPVDGSVLVGGWSALRRSDWGFGPEALPLNGRVWYPEGAGPFPLVLIVHGNHIAEDFSDPGYEYLGELLASRGYIFVSVDENFLNLSPSADMGGLFSLSEEDDARGWLLLEHLKAWKGWNENAGNPFYQKVDLKNIGLIGHSRGGEAVAVAATFNRLPYYPDDANLAFDYHFGIRAVAAIAPIDGQYQPTSRPLPLENVSYFVLHGVQDMQTNYVGRRMYDRLKFTDQNFHFKSALYFYGGNHGQFNTVWGSRDVTEPGMRLYNERTLMQADDQRQIAKVYLSAFLEIGLRDKTEYLPIFRDARYAPGWLPDTVYLTQYNDTATRLVATFDEDIDLTTTTLAGGISQGQNLTTWFERRLLTKNFSRLDTSAVYLGWDTQAIKEPAAYIIRLPEQDLGLSTQSTLVFALGAFGGAAVPIDLTIEVVDRNGNLARLPLSSYALLQPRLEANLLKAASLSSMPNSEVVLQNFEFPLEAFTQMNPAFNPKVLAEVHLVLDRTPEGEVVLDDLGFR